MIEKMPFLQPALAVQISAVQTSGFYVVSRSKIPGMDGRPAFFSLHARVVNLLGRWRLIHWQRLVWRQSALR